MAEHQLALVVGANRGIGLGVVKEFLGRGWSVIATARRPEQATELNALAAEQERGRVTILKLEMNDPVALDGFPRALNDRMVDIVLINAGISGPAHKSASAVTEQELGTLMYTNAIAPIRLARSLADHVRPGPGVLAFTSSIMGSVSLNTGGHELYRASKAALNQLARGLYPELARRKLTMLSLHPGWVRTDMTGDAAPVSVTDSAHGMVSVMIREQATHRHVFIDYLGKTMPW
jgi:NAD(P)-dependent dehydrogenase (short-subunit alcohol dehydrogenase family)